jgi:hypothetical protein
MSVTIKTYRDAAIYALKTGNNPTKSSTSKKLDYKTVEQICGDCRVFRRRMHLLKIKTAGIDRLDNANRYVRALSVRKNNIAESLFFSGRGSTWHYEKRGDWSRDKYSKSYHRQYGAAWVSDGCWLVERGVMGSIVSERSVANEASAKKLLVGLAEGYAEKYHAEIGAESAKKKMAAISVLPVYKMVAQREDGKLVSIFDGVTEYGIGKVVSSPVVVRGDICTSGGIFVHRDEFSARKQGFPGSAKAADLPRVLLAGYAWGRKRENGKIAAEYFAASEIFA